MCCLRPKGRATTRWTSNRACLTTGVRQSVPLPFFAEARYHPQSSTRTVTLVPQFPEANRHIIKAIPVCFKGRFGSFSGNLGFRIRADLWQLPECVYLPLAARHVCSLAALGVPQLQKGHSALSQYSGI